MKKRNPFTKWFIVIVISLVIAVIDHACVRRSKAEEWTPSDGGTWQPPTWIDNLVTPEPEATVSPTELPDPTSGPILFAPSRSYLYFNQANWSYIPGSTHDQLYIHTSNDGTNSYINWPPYSLDPVQRLNSSSFSTGRYLPYSGKTNSSNPFDSRYAGYMFCLREEPRLGQWDFGDCLTYDLQFPSIKLFQQSGLSNIQFQLFQELGYNSPDLLTIEFYVTQTITDSSTGVYRNLLTNSFSFKYSEAMQGVSLDIDIARFVEDEEYISSITTLCVINPYGDFYYGDILTPLRDAYSLDTQNVYDHTKWPQYNFANEIGSDYGIYIVRHVGVSNRSESISLVSRALQWLFVPTDEQIDQLLDTYISDENTMNDTTEVAYTLRNRIYALFSENDISPNIELDLPGCEIPINGTTYTLWQPYHFDLLALWIDSGSDPADLQDIIYMVHFATDALITCAFVNSLFALVVAIWDLHHWKGVEGEDIT